MSRPPTRAPSRAADPSGLAARLAAINLLDAVLRQGAALDDSLRKSRALGELTARDRAFARLLLATTLRRLGQIDALIDARLNRPLPEALAAVRNILRIGAVQLVVLEAPAHAVVDTAVRLAERIGRTSHKGLINAVLRRIAAEGPALFAAQDAARLNTPDYFWRSWVAAYGEDTTRAIAAQHQRPPPLDLTVKDDATGWAERLGGTVIGAQTVRLAETAEVTGLAGFADGAWWVQDAAAALPARLLLSALDGGEAKRVVDLCAAPGGKTAQLAAAGARVTAIDRADSRLDMLRENMARLHLAVGTVTADARHWRPDTPPAGILLDAPCTATGTLRRHPDIARNKGAEDVARLVILQRQLLETAARALPPGGVLVYAVCSLQPEEGPMVIDRLLAARPDLKRLPVTAGEVWLGARALTPRGDVRTLPCHLAAEGGIDGFYIARLVKPG